MVTMDNRNRGPWIRAGTTAFVLVVVVGSVGWLYRQCQVSSGIAFLPATAPSPWILYPTMDYIGSKRLLPGVNTVFRKEFTLERVPDRVTLRFAVYRDCRITVNGTSVYRGQSEKVDWKQAKEIDVQGFLRPGANIVEVTVFNEKGPPSLSLALEGSGLDIRADASWLASYAGAAEKHAVFASEPRPGWRIPDDSIPPNTWTALVQSLPTLLGFAAFSAVCLWMGRQRRLLEDPLFGRLRWIAVAFWCVLFVNNFRFLNYNVGFDALDHIHYIKLIQARHSLPAAHEGRETHQPPLFYLICAGLLEIGRLNPTSSAGIAVLRAFTLSLGVAQLLCILGSLKIVFPSDRAKQLLGGIFAAVLPMHLFIFQYVTNESLIAALSAGAIYWTLRILNQPTTRDAAILGCLLGAALWTKISAFGLVPVVFTSLALAALTRWRDPRPSLVHLAIPVTIAAMIAAPFYLRVWREHHTLFVRHVDMEGSIGGRHWKDPGVRTGADYSRFGEVLADPYFAGFHSFADAIYSTYWGDGRLGGKGASDFSPPWNMKLMTAGYLLALLPSLALLLGLFLAVARFLRHPDPVWFLLLGIAYVFFFAVLHESMRNPYLHSTKAWYGVPAATSVCVFLSLGMDALATRIGVLRQGVFTAFGVWAMTAAFSMWSPTQTSSIESLGAAWNDDNRNFEASKVFAYAVAFDPHDASLRWRIGRLFRQIQNLEHAESNLRAAIAADPNFTPARYELADLLLSAGRVDEAATILAEASQQGIDVESGRSVAGDLKARQGQFEAAVTEYREALSRWPTTPQLHAKLADAYERLGDQDSAERHRQYAVTRSTSRKESRKVDDNKP